ncbi:Sugar transport protein 5-like protein [Drosera capensis]
MAVASGGVGQIFQLQAIQEIASPSAFHPPTNAILVLALMCMYIAGFGCSWGPLAFLVPSKIFPLKIRPTGQNISIAMNFGVIVVLSQSFLSMLCHFRLAANPSTFHPPRTTAVDTDLIVFRFQSNLNFFFSLSSLIKLQAIHSRDRYAPIPMRLTCQLSVLVDQHASQDSVGRITAAVVVSCVIPASGGLIFGYDVRISGGVTTMAGFQQKSWLKSIIYVSGRLIGSKALVLCRRSSDVAMAIALGVITDASGDRHISKDHAILVLALMCLYAAGFGCSWGPLAFLVPREIFPLKIRPTGQSISIAMNFAVVFVLSQTFLSMLCHLRYGAFLFFAALS